VIFLLALLPATALTVAGYVALFLSARCSGAMHSFGKFLGFWAFTLAGLVILGALFAAAHYRHHGMHGMHCPWITEPGMRPAPPPGAPEPQGPPPQAAPPASH
jgi:hypothetical protein